DAERDLQAVADRIVAAGGPGSGPAAFRLHSVVDPDFQFRGFHLAMVLAVVAVLLVACSNLANIQLARGITRRRELALRSALGATRRRLIAHLLIESVLLALCGLALGLVLTYWSAHALQGAIPRRIAQFVVEPQWSWRVGVFALLATACCVVLVGLLPAIRVSRADPNELLKSGAGTGATKQHRRQYSVLVAGEIGLALVLSSAAAVLIHSAMQFNDNQLAIDPSIITTGTTFPRFTKGTTIRRADVLRTLAARLRAIRGVEDAAAMMGKGTEHDIVSYSDFAGVHEFPAPMYSAYAVSPSYLRTVGLHVTRGRDFLDGQSDDGAVIVDQHTADLLWPNSDPVGQQIKFGDHRSSAPFLHVVGVVGNNVDARTQRMLRAAGVRFKQLGTIYYVPGVHDTLVISSKLPFLMQFFARTPHDPERMALTISAIAAGWSDFPYAQAYTMDRPMAELRATRNFVSRLFTLFAALGLGLAAFGVYGVVAHSVAERRRELGVRIALGATARDILHAVLRESVVVGLAGVAVGLLLTKYGVLLLASFAIEDDFFNAPLFAAVALFLFAVAAAAAFAPAFRATRIDPTESLRCE
ncbi:MAG TPA: FtsX-like permease family protein, partial [Gemmatimonadaceae bacterium]|nr:FtsX-like permease family protein [Gemmatimonadaceae bacterium]